MGNRDHVGEAEFRKINWLPVQARFEQCVSTHIFKYINNGSPVYMKDLFVTAEQTKIKTRSQYGVKLFHPHRSKLSGQKAMSSIGPKVWNSLPEDIRGANNVNIFKHKVKTFYFERIKKYTDASYLYQGLK